MCHDVCFEKIVYPRKRFLAIPAPLSTHGWIDREWLRVAGDSFSNYHGVSAMTKLYTARDFFYSQTNVFFTIPGIFYAQTEMKKRKSNVTSKDKIILLSSELMELILLDFQGLDYMQSSYYKWGLKNVFIMA